MVACELIPLSHRLRLRYACNLTGAKSWQFSGLPTILIDAHVSCELTLLANYTKGHA